MKNNFIIVLFILLFFGVIDMYALNQKTYTLQTNYYLSLKTGKDHNFQYLASMADGCFVIYKFDDQSAMVGGNRAKIRSEYDFNSVIDSKALFQEFEGFVSKYIRSVCQIEIQEFYDETLKNGITDFPYTVLDSPNADYSLNIKSVILKNSLYTLWLNGYDNIMTKEGLFSGVDYFVMSALDENVIADMITYALENYLAVCKLFERYPNGGAGIVLEMTIQPPPDAKNNLIESSFIVNKGYTVSDQTQKEITIKKSLPLFDKSVVLKEIFDAHLFVLSMNGKLIDYNFGVDF